jgi:hypothetical protein
MINLNGKGSCHAFAMAGRLGSVVLKHESKVIGGHLLLVVVVEVTRIPDVLVSWVSWMAD